MCSYRINTINTGRVFEPTAASVIDFLKFLFSTYAAHQLSLALMNQNGRTIPLKRKRDVHWKEVSLHMTTTGHGTYNHKSYSNFWKKIINYCRNGGRTSSVFPNAEVRRIVQSMYEFTRSSATSLALSDTFSIDRQYLLTAIGLNQEETITNADEDDATIDEDDATGASEKAVGTDDEEVARDEQVTDREVVYDTEDLLIRLEPIRLFLEHSSHKDMELLRAKCRALGSLLKGGSVQPPLCSEDVGDGPSPPLRNSRLEALRQAPSPTEDFFCLSVDMEDYFDRDDLQSSGGQGHDSLHGATWQPPSPTVSVDMADPYRKHPHHMVLRPKLRHRHQA